MGVLQAYAKHDLNTDIYGEYFKGALNISDTEKQTDVLLEAFKEVYPQLSQDQIEDKIMRLGE